MSRERFDDECPGCQPTMVDVKTGRPLPDDSVEMTIVNQLWSKTTREQRLAWHRFTCQNSRAPEDLKLVKAFSDRLDAAFAALATKKKERV